MHQLLVVLRKGIQALDVLSCPAVCGTLFPTHARLIANGALAHLISNSIEIRECIIVWTA
jgi:hypothetical protein